MKARASSRVSSGTVSAGTMPCYSEHREFQDMLVYSLESYKRGDNTHAS